MAEQGEPGAGTVLLCEDEAIVALDLKIMVEEAGYRVAGPFARVAAALKLVEEPFVAAILDVRLRDGDVFPVAERLAERGVPLIFHSAHIVEDDIAARFPGARYCPKPVEGRLITSALRTCAARELPRVPAGAPEPPSD